MTQCRIARVEFAEQITAPGVRCDEMLRQLGLLAFEYLHGRVV